MRRRIGGRDRSILYNFAVLDKESVGGTRVEGTLRLLYNFIVFLSSKDLPCGLGTMCQRATTRRRSTCHCVGGWLILSLLQYNSPHYSRTRQLSVLLYGTNGWGRTRVYYFGWLYRNYILRRGRQRKIKQIVNVFLLKLFIFITTRQQREGLPNGGRWWCSAVQECDPRGARD